MTRRASEWSVPRDTSYLADMVYVLRDEHGAVEVVHERHVMGLFARARWLELIAAAGFQPLAVPFDHDERFASGHEVFLGLRPEATC